MSDVELIAIMINNSSKSFLKEMGWDLKKFTCFVCGDSFKVNKISLYHTKLRFCCNNPFCELRFFEKVSGISP